MTIHLANFNQDAYPATDEFQCLTITIPAGDEYKWLLAGLMYQAGIEANYIDPESEQAQGVAQLWRDAYLTTDWEQCMTPEKSASQSQISLFPNFSAIESGAALVFVNNTASWLAGYWQSSSIAAGDAQSQQIWLSPGDYKLTVMYTRLTNNCKLTVIIQRPGGADSQVVINQLDIHGATLVNQKTTATFTITEFGEWQIYWLSNGAPTGGGNNMPLVMTQIQRTADI